MSIPAIEEHYRQNRQKLVKKFSFRAGSPEGGEDVVQEAYARAIQYKESCNDERFDQWFSTILNNCLRDFKNEERGYVQEDEDEEEVAENPHCPHFPERIMREIYELIDTKSLTQQEVLNFYFKQDYTAADISRVTEHSYANCAKIISRFRQELKDLYG